MKYEIQELKKFINSVCSKNICNATKEMALSHLARIEAKFEEQIPQQNLENEYYHRSVQTKIIHGDGIFG